MNTDNDLEVPAGQGADSPQDKDNCCDPSDIDELQCKMVGIAKQAEYNAGFTALLVTAKDDYEKTRTLYRQTRHEAHIKVQDLTHDIKSLTEGIRCRIEQERVVRNLDKAFDTVVEQLKDCEPEAGCCCAESDCDFDLRCRELSYKKLVKRIEKYQARTAAAQTCFTALVGEPAALEVRVAACKDAVDKINAALLQDPATTDLKVVYVAALVAERDISRVWNGHDSVNDFVECLCCALTCWTNGGGAVSKLLGEQAVRDCHRKSKQDHCIRLQGSTVDEIIAVYDKICADDRPCADDTDRPDTDRPDPDRPGTDRHGRGDNGERQNQDQGEDARLDRGPHGERSWYERHGGRER